jgi:hypothetical protein
LDKNNKILLGAILLIFMTIISFNINTITGDLTKEGKKVPSVTVSPKVVVPGERVTVSVWTGADGINERACLYDDNSRVACTNRVCSDSPENLDRAYKCYSTGKEQVKFNFATSTSLPSGIYSICVWDYELASKKLRQGDSSQQRAYVCGDFTIMENLQ